MRDLVFYFILSLSTINDRNLNVIFVVFRSIVEGTQKSQTADDYNVQSTTRDRETSNYTMENRNDFYSARSDSRVRRGPKGDTGEKGEPGRDGLNGMTGISGPPGHVFMLPVMYKLIV